MIEEIFQIFSEIELSDHHYLDNGILAAVNNCLALSALNHNLFCM